MLNEEEIEKAKGWLSALDIKSEFEAILKETLLQYIDQLELEVRATEKVHEYDIKMIDEVKGEAVKLYKKIDKQNKIIDEMAMEIKETNDWYNDYCGSKTQCAGECENCIKQYFEKKVKKG